MKSRTRILAGAAIAAIGAVALLQLGSAANAQILPSSTTTTTERPRTTTTTLVPSTTTELATTTTVAPSPASTVPATSTTAPRRRTTTTTAPAATSTTFVPPEGVPAGPTTTVPADGPLEADLGWLPWMVALSIGGFAVAIGIVAVQWVRTRP